MMEVERFHTREERSGRQTSIDETPLAAMSCVHTWHWASVTCKAKINTEPHNNTQAILYKTEECDTSLG